MLEMFTMTLSLYLGLFLFSQATFWIKRNK